VSLGSGVPRKFSDFEAQNGEFWRILGALVYSSAACFTRKKLVLLGLENLQQLHAVHCCTAGMQKSKRQNKPVGNSKVKTILYGIGSKML